jgi:hypothetical protein
MNDDTTGKSSATLTRYADAIAALHLLFVTVVVWVQALVLLGALLGWDWVYDPVLRLCHLGLVGFVGVQDLLGRVCPLTTWENDFRRKAGQAPSDKSFIGRVVHSLLMCELNERTLRRIRLTFAAVVLLTFVLIFPHFS